MNQTSQKSIGIAKENMTGNKQFLQNFISNVYKYFFWAYSLITVLNLDFDEQKFDLDEYEKRLQKFENYLKNRDERELHLKELNEQKSQASSTQNINESIKDALDDKDLEQRHSDDAEERKSLEFNSNGSFNQQSYKYDRQLTAGGGLSALAQRQESCTTANQQLFQNTNNQNNPDRDPFLDLSDIFRSYCDKYRPLDKRSKVHLKKINNITNKWRQPLYKANFFNNQPANEKVGQMVSIAKSINYLQKKKQEYELKIQTYNKNSQVLQKELDELTSEFENYQYQTYQELVDEIQCIKESNEYLLNASKDPQHYLRVQVEEMELNSRKLKRYERLNDLIKKNSQELRECEKFNKATVEDLQRLKIREKYLLNQSVDSFGVAAASSQDLQASGIYEYDQRSR
eukprot:403343894